MFKRTTTDRRIMSINSLTLLEVRLSMMVLSAGKSCASLQQGRLRELRQIEGQERPVWRPGWRQRRWCLFFLIKVN
jgi:hypothetical protein